jgi:hypothetical protein
VGIERAQLDQLARLAAQVPDHQGSLMAATVVHCHRAAKQPPWRFVCEKDFGGEGIPFSKPS